MNKIDLKTCVARTKVDVWENSISQNAEDITIKEIINELEMPETDKVAVDVGSWDGMHLSNIYNLLTIDGWGGILVEGDLNKSQVSKNRFVDNPHIHHYDGFVNRENNNINTILSRYNCPEEFGVFNLDIDSFDFWIWKDLNYKPKIVCVEHNGNILDDDKVLPYDTSWTYSGSQDNYGASAKSLLRLGNHKGYSLVAASLHNLIFVKDSLAEKFEVIEEIDVNWFRETLGITKRSSFRQHMPPEYFHYNPPVN